MALWQLMHLHFVATYAHNVRLHTDGKGLLTRFHGIFALVLTDALENINKIRLIFCQTYVNVSFTNCSIS